MELNTASSELLSYVSGLGQQLAKKIVEYRNEHGPFRSRRELVEVPRLGDKAFEQAAGFLRIRNGENLLDASAVHPESYYIVEKMAENLNCGVEDLMKNPALRNKIDLKKYVTEETGLPTLNDSQ
nr:helix-hairpin-helix domain-containing protein [Candidatus Kuenenia stuttgartiensis]